MLRVGHGTCFWPPRLVLRIVLGGKTGIRCVLPERYTCLDNLEGTQYSCMVSIHF